ncbi:SRPBCC family protein [Lapidilactobacillus mulanensis]|uniref:SRPBCC family protein n=1 Tax=Lapidilactobacillus mulanensis TaxID=2485999 RepID=A0ABW4DPB3_9LACO|nr:SRPBCC family protein [Lapidilactobacillus mulanensis]
MVKISHTVEVPLPIEIVFAITNNISLWPTLFSEYSKVDILEQKKHFVKFKLYWQNENGEISSWISERKSLENEYRVLGERVDALYPFKFMKIDWKYNQIGNNTSMTWSQEFDAAEDTDISVEDMKDHLQIQIIQEMRVVSRNVLKYYKNSRKKKYGK